MATEMSLKLLINKSSNKVLFAEAGKDFVDFLFSLLSMPLGSIYRLLSKEDMVGSLGNLYTSLESLNKSYMQRDLHRDLALNPVITKPVLTQNLTKLQSFRCPSCGRQMDVRMTCLSPIAAMEKKGRSRGGGYVKGVVTYMVMNDLVVTPMSAISSMILLSKFQVKEVGSLEEKVVHVGTKEGLKLLKAALESRTVSQRRLSWQEEGHYNQLSSFLWHLSLVKCMQDFCVVMQDFCVVRQMFYVEMYASWVCV